MPSDWFWIVIQIGTLITVPIAALQAFNLWFLLRYGDRLRFWYRPLRGERFLTTRAERPGWYWFMIIEKVASLIAYLALIAVVGYGTFHPR